MNNPKQNINSINILKQAIKVFSSVNKRVNTLIDCSANDFNILNNEFKEYYKRTSNLTINTEKLFINILELINRVDENDLVFTDSLLKNIEIVSKSTIDISTRTNNLKKEVSYLYMFLNNLKQNISTLKLVATNMQFEPKFHRIYNELIERIDIVQKCSHTFDEKLQSTENYLEQFVNLSFKIKNNQLPLALASLKIHHDNLTRFLDKRETCKEFSTKLKDLNSKKSSSSAEIITNLQFQDIIRQKIEHVQEAHEVLLSKLDKNYENVRKKKPNNDDILKIVYQIRNIGSLQAAQLMHANNEYQKAVDVIISRFDNLDHIIIETNIILSEFSPQTATTEEFSFENVFRSNKNIQVEISTCTQLIKDLQQLYNNIIRNEDPLFDSCHKLKKAVDNCQSVIVKMRGLHDENNSELTRINPLMQLLNNFEDLLANSNETCRIFDENHINIQEKLVPDLEKYFNISQSFEKELIEHYIKLDQLLPLIIAEIDSGHSLVEKSELNKNKFDPHHLQYYQVFEREIEGIISEINTLSNNIDLDELERSYDSENFAKIQELYTMESEREVHSMITGMKNNESNTTDDIELF